MRLVSPALRAESRAAAASGARISAERLCEECDRDSEVQAGQALKLVEGKSVGDWASWGVGCCGCTVGSCAGVWSVLGIFIHRKDLRQVASVEVTKVA